MHALWQKSNWCSSWPKYGLRSTLLLALFALLVSLLASCSDGGFSGSSNQTGTIAIKLRNSAAGQKQGTLVARDSNGDEEEPYLNRLLVKFYADEGDHQPGDFLLERDEEVQPGQETVLLESIPAPQDYYIAVDIYYSDSEEPYTTANFIATVLPDQTAVATPVTPQLVEIQLAPSQEVTIPIGVTQQYQAIAVYTDGTDVDVTAEAAWSVSDESVATISDEGLATGQAVGECLVSASWNGLTTSQAKLIVTAATITALTLTPEQEASIMVGRTQQYQATASYSDGTEEDVTTAATWSVSDPLVAEISDEGLATGLATGECLISATWAGITTSQVKLTVTPAIITALTLDPDEDMSILAGNTQQYKAIARYEDGYEKDVATLATWSVSDSKIATISEGLATGLSAGECLVSASWAGTTTSQAKLTVQASTTCTIAITNAYGLDIPEAKYALTLQNAKKSTVQTEGKTPYMVQETANGSVGSCTIVCHLPVSTYSVVSVTLSNPTRGTAFEWLDYYTPQALVNNAITLDVQQNEFAGGNGTEKSPYYVGNPRQLDNVRLHPTVGKTAVYFTQINDIDFGGSCGLTVSVGFDANSHIVTTPTIVDDQARFLNKGVLDDESLGWIAIEGDETAAAGTHYRGENHVIDGLVSYAPKSNGLAGLFAKVYWPYVYNLTMGEHCFFHGGNSAGAFVAVASYYCYCRYCTSKATVSVKPAADQTEPAYGGGVCGYSKSFIANDCQVDGPLYGAGCSYVGGLVGQTFAVGYLQRCVITSKFSLECLGCGGGLLGSYASLHVNELSNDSVTSTFDLRTPLPAGTSSAEILSYGGFIGKIDDVIGYPTIETGTSAAKFDCTQLSGDELKVYVGGAVAQFPADTTVEQAKKMFTDIDITGCSYQGTHPGVKYCKYSVVPEVDSL